MSYIGNEPVVSATRTITEITATAGQTVFIANGGYTVGFIDVFVNGAQLQTSDFTATDGSTVTLSSAATVGDDVRLVAWGTFSTGAITPAALTSGAPTWSPTGGVSLPRIDSSTEGGQLNFNRASDNTGNWSIDSYGSGSTPSLRFIDGANVRATIDGSGNVGIGTSSPDFYLYGGNRKFLTAQAAATNQEQFLQLISNGTGNSLIDFGNQSVRRSAIIGFDGSHLGFFTNGSNSGTTVTERMRIDSSGRVTTPYQPAFCATGTSGTTTVAAGALIPINNTFFNRGSHYNTSSYLFTAPVAGVYCFTASIYIQGAASICFKVNGAEHGTPAPLIFVPSTDQWDQSGAISLVVSLSANDTVGVASRGTQSSLVYTPHSTFTGYLIG